LRICFNIIRVEHYFIVGTTEKVFTDKIEELEKTITKQINIINEESEIFKANVSETY